VIAPPFGDEYLKAHRALRQLALRLSRAGFHVLRFDFRGCGDSAGGPEALGLADWAADVAVAIDELKDRCGVGRIALVGLRLGATLSLLAGARRRDVDALVLWEPVLDGAAHLAEIARAAEAWRTAERVDLDKATDLTELMGFPIGDALRRSLSTLNLELPRRPARRVLLLGEKEEAAAAVNLVLLLRQLGAAPEQRQTAEAGTWLAAGRTSRTLVPQAAITAVADWLAGEAA